MEPHGGGWIQSDGDGVLIHLRAQPGASRNEITGVAEGRLRVRVQAPPVEGAANAALCRFLAKSLGVAKSRASIVRGDRSREKTLHVAGVNTDEARRKLGIPPPDTAE